MKRTTAELMSEIKEAENVDEFIRSNGEELCRRSVSELLNEIMDSRGLARSRIIEESQINRVYAYQLFSGIRATPKRDKLLALLIAAGLNIGEIQDFLKKTGYSQLYVRNERDCIIIFGIENGQTVIEINRELFKHSMETL